MILFIMQTGINGDLVREKKPLTTTHVVLTEANNKLWPLIFNILITAAVRWCPCFAITSSIFFFGQPLAAESLGPFWGPARPVTGYTDREERGNGYTLGCLGLVFWFKQFPAMSDMIKMTKRLGNVVLRLTLHVLPAATQMHTVIRDTNSGARVGGRHLESPGLCQFASNLLFHCQCLNEMEIYLFLHWIPCWFLKQNQTIHGRLWNMQCFARR